ncbi:lysophospholipid acyltransferase family protein [Hugenholtzia roseola]|uniref:lysophospholipid acyltransferase family protein n=1 Tax=Hugenholtzia roseola TaxID=1002 RepID=UPI0003FA93C5|nr:lysophospholipid acyltransferase family protein [Hugenholtzia roseola]
MLPFFYDAAMMLENQSFPSPSPVSARNRLLGWLFTPLFATAFFGVLLLNHLCQVVAFRFFGYQAHKKTVDWLCIWLLGALRCIGSKVRYHNLAGKLPTDRPLILVSNHQGMYDIPAIGWFFRHHHPKYVTKKELSKGIPAISFNVRNGGSAVIDRNNRLQALTALKEFAIYLGKNKYAGCIFPEGTRSRDGSMRAFKPAGLAMMLKYMPDALIVPIALENFWQIERFKFKPVPFAMPLSVTILPFIEPNGKNETQIIELCQEAIQKQLGALVLA